MKRSFSLIELVVVTGLLVSGLLFFQALVLGNRNLTNESSERVQARSLALARIGELRSMLRSADLTVPANHDARFQAVVDEDSSAGAPTLPATATLQWGGARWQATVTVETFRSGTGGVQEATANAQMATLDVLNVDVNADGDTNDADVPIAQLEVVPVIVEVTWRGANDTAATALHRQRFGALLY